MSESPPTKKHFTRRELCRSDKAKDAGLTNECPEELYAALERTMEGCERVRAFLMSPMKIHSGYRSPELNALIGGAKNSQHMKAEAVDFTCPGYGTPADIFAGLLPEIEALGIDQLILEPGWVHASFTEKPRLQALRLEGSRYVPIERIG